MRVLGTYLMGLVAAAIVAAVVSALGRMSSLPGLLRLLCGLFLTLSALGPLLRWDPIRLDPVDTYRTQAQRYVQQGQARSEQARRAIIKERCEAYILKEAAGVQGALEAEVALSPEGLPQSVTLTGRWTPQAKAALSAAIHTQLGIAKENQQWIS